MASLHDLNALQQLSGPEVESRGGKDGGSSMNLGLGLTQRVQGLGDGGIYGSGFRTEVSM